MYAYPIYAWNIYLLPLTPPPFPQISPPWAALIRSLAERRALTPLPSPLVNFRAPPPAPTPNYLRDRLSRMDLVT